MLTQEFDVHAFFRFTGGHETTMVAVEDRIHAAPILGTKAEMASTTTDGSSSPSRAACSRSVNALSTPPWRPVRASTPTVSARRALCSWVRALTDGRVPHMASRVVRVDVRLFGASPATSLYTSSSTDRRISIAE